MGHGIATGVDRCIHDFWNALGDLCADPSDYTLQDLFMTRFIVTRLRPLKCTSVAEMAN